MTSSYAECIRALTTFEREFDFAAVSYEIRCQITDLCERLREGVITGALSSEQLLRRTSEGSFGDLLSTVSRQLSDLQSRLNETGHVPRSSCDSPSFEQVAANPHFVPTLGERCPTFAGKFPVSGPGVTMSRGNTWVDVFKGSCSLNESQFKEWLCNRNSWAIKDVSHSRKSDVVTFRAYCRFGGSALIHSAQLESGSKRPGAHPNRGFMKQVTGFRNCPGKIKAVVSFRAGGTVIHAISILVDDNGDSHTHGDFTKGPVDHKLCKIDPTLTVHNAINSTAIDSPFLRPVQVLCANINNFESNGYSNILTDLNRDLLRNVQSLCSKARGLSGTITIDELRSMKEKLELEWLQLPADVKDHMPRIVAICEQGSRDGTKFAVMISTTSMLKNAAYSPSGLLAVDCTFKVNACDYPLLVITTEDYNQECFPIAFTFVHSEDTSAYVMALQQIKLYVQNSLSIETWCPRFLMGDASLSIDAAMTKVFSDSARPPLRLQCYFHVVKQVRTQLKSLGLNKAEKSEFILNMQTMACAISTSAFRLSVDELERHWQSRGKERLVEYIQSRNGYFDSSSSRSHWYRVC